MAKKKSDKGRLDVLLESAKSAHKFDAGVGGDIYTVDPGLSNVRGIRLPSLGMMDMFGFTALRDSCTVLIDGAPGANKSSLAIDILNWSLPYAGSGAIFDCENKGAFDVATGMLNPALVWVPGRLLMRTCTSVEDAQKQISELAKRCKKTNEGFDRDDHMPVIQITDSLAGISSEGSQKALNTEGYSDRGHAGREEALLWSAFMKSHQTQLLTLPMISVFINHQKTRQVQAGARTYNESYNPGGVAQNFHATIQLTCACPKAGIYISDSVGGISHATVRVMCTKSSRGPTGRMTAVRKCSMRNEDGTTRFWWDWGRNTAEWVMSRSSSHPVSKIVNIKKTGKADEFSCDEVGLKAASISDIGDAIMANEDLLTEICKASRFLRIKEFNRLTPEEFSKLAELAEKERSARSGIEEG